MKALYIIAWICLVLCIIVHVLAILGQEDILSDIDVLFWLLHGGVILLGLPLVLCSQKLIVGIKEKDFWKAVLKDCPSWMRRMAGFFVLYGIINFIFFTRTFGTVENVSSPTVTDFRYVSSFWMIFYSIEIAVFHSYLKKKSSDAQKNVLSDQILPMDKDSRQQYDPNGDSTQTKWSKYSRIIMIFIIVGAIFLFLLWLAIIGYPWFLGCTLFSLVPFVAIHAIYIIYFSWRWNRYMQKNHFKIWKKGKSYSLADRVESQRLVNELDDSYLKTLNLKATRFSTICLYIWLVVVVLINVGLVLLQNYTNPSAG
jgi:hypothetical protein